MAHWQDKATTAGSKIFIFILLPLRVLSISIFVECTLLNIRKAASLILGSLISQSDFRSELTTIDETKMRLKRGEGKGHRVSTSDVAYPRIEDERGHEFAQGLISCESPDPTRCSELKQVERAEYIAQAFKEAKWIRHVLATAR